MGERDCNVFAAVVAAVVVAVVVVVYLSKSKETSQNSFRNLLDKFLCGQVFSLCLASDKLFLVWVRFLGICKQRRKASSCSLVCFITLSETKITPKGSKIAYETDMDKVREQRSLA